MTWLDRPDGASRSSRAALRRRAAARERARLGRDLHDGVMQGLIAIDMQLETALRSSPHDSGHLAASLECAQLRLRAEMTALRVVVDESRSRDVAPEQLARTIDS